VPPANGVVLPPDSVAESPIALPTVTRTVAEVEIVGDFGLTVEVSFRSPQVPATALLLTSPVYDRSSNTSRSFPA